MSVLNTKTKKFLAILAAAAFVWEMAAVFGYVQYITDATAELSCDRPWIPYWLGALMVHFFFPRRSTLVPSMSLGLFLASSFSITVGWELYLLKADPSVIDWFCRHMWVPAVVGGYAGHLGFTRRKMEREK